MGRPRGKHSAAGSYLSPLTVPTLGGLKLYLSVGNSGRLGTSKVKNTLNKGEVGQSLTARHKGCGWDGAKCMIYQCLQPSRI